MSGSLSSLEWKYFLNDPWNVFPVEDIWGKLKLSTFNQMQIYKTSLLIHEKSLFRKFIYCRSKILFNSLIVQDLIVCDAFFNRECILPHRISASTPSVELNLAFDKLWRLVACLQCYWCVFQKLETNLWWCL